MLKKVLFSLLVVLALGIACGLLLLYVMAGPARAIPPINQYGQDTQATLPTTFSVLSLNLAHGRRDAGHQISQTTPQIRTNLDGIINLLKREQPDLVALQEADGPSLWSGRFSHVAYLAQGSDYSHATRGTHVAGLGLSYGTALLSRTPLTRPLSITFPPRPPTLTKGFTVATVLIGQGLEVDIVSVHLDFFSKRTRKKQVTIMAEKLAKRQRPLIILGDFNNTWQENSAPQVLSRALSLSTYQPDNNALITFPSRQKRIDFILFSAEFECVRFTTLTDVVSDHRAILARLRVKNP